MSGTNEQGIQMAGTKRGAPSGNRNNQRHGLRSGRLPVKCKYIENAVNSLRRALEAAVMKARGEVSIADAASINSACKWETHSMLARRWLRSEAEKLSPADRLRFSEAVAKASDNRDRNIRALGLDRDAKDNIIDALYSRVPLLPAANGSSDLEDK